jgi:2-phospho-L-lactate/phosphoenolpyruvate guanylyltransferase
MRSQRSAPSTGRAAERAWGVVVPAKPVASAKSRLAPLGDQVRRDLVTAFLHDTVRAVLDSARVRLVVVVTDDVDLASTVTGLGAWAIPDGHAGDLNASLVQGAADVLRRVPGVGLLTTVADLPALRADDLDDWLETDPAADPAMVTDVAGSGTTMLRARTRGDFRPQFGPGSRAVHLTDGVSDLSTSAADGLRRDVDTPADLLAARRLGLGERTRWVLTRHGL